MSIYTTRAELAQLVSNKVEENIHLDFKASNALRPNGGKGHDARRADLAKDISSLANTDGGHIIYGVTDIKDRADSFDAGFGPDEEFKAVWFHQVLREAISPPVAGIDVAWVEVASGRYAIVVAVPKSFRGPHQRLFDKRFFRRYGSENKCMEAYEIEEVRRRREVSPPAVRVSLGFRGQVIIQIVFENVSEFPVKDLKTTPSPELATYFATRGSPPGLMQGLAVLQPGERITYNGPVTFEVFAGSCPFPRAFSVRVQYVHPTTGTDIADLFEFDLDQYGFAAALKTDSENVRDEVRDQLRDVVRALERIASQLAGPERRVVSGAKVEKQRLGLPRRRRPQERKPR